LNNFSDLYAVVKRKVREKGRRRRVSRGHGRVLLVWLRELDTFGEIVVAACTDELVAAGYLRAMRA